MQGLKMSRRKRTKTRTEKTRIEETQRKRGIKEGGKGKWRLPRQLNLLAEGDGQYVGFVTSPLTDCGGPGVQALIHKALACQLYRLNFFEPVFAVYHKSASRTA